MIMTANNNNYPTPSAINTCIDMQINVMVRGNTCIYTINWCNNRYSRRSERQQIQLSARKGTPQTVVATAICNAVKNTINTCYTI